MSTNIDERRRRFLTASTAVVGTAGLSVSTWPFIASWQPSARARAVGAPVVVDLAKLEPGQQITVEWRGMPVWILHRGSGVLNSLRKFTSRLRDPDSRVVTQQPTYARNEYRSVRPQYLIAIGLCTHLGCVPRYRPELAPADLGPEWVGGYFCPCHGSRFDLAGRVFVGVPAPTNLVIPPHRYLGNSVVEIGVDDIAS